MDSRNASGLKPSEKGYKPRVIGRALSLKGCSTVARNRDGQPSLIV